VEALEAIEVIVNAATVATEKEEEIVVSAVAVSVASVEVGANEAEISHKSDVVREMVSCWKESEKEIETDCHTILI
jgi:hypothetical protein